MNKWVVALVVGWVAFCLSLVGGVVYVAGHFITKFW